jgi:hypothetical protein
VNKWPVVIHCSATLNGRSLADNGKDSAEVIDEWHRERGFDSIGYHFVIDPCGTVLRGRPLNKMGAHCKGFNKSWGICMIGTDKYTQQQFSALRAILESLRISPFDLKPWDIWCHNEKSIKTCPGMRIADIVLWYRALEYGAIDKYLIKETIGL